MLNRKAEGL